RGGVHVVQHLRFGDAADVGRKQAQGGDYGGGDVETFGQRFGGVADRVEARDDAVRGLVTVALFIVQRAAHFKDAVGVVRDGAVSVHRQDETGGGQQSQSGQRHAVGGQRRAFKEREGNGHRRGD